MVTVTISYGYCYDQLWSLLRSVMVTVMISYGHCYDQLWSLL